MFHVKHLGKLKLVVITGPTASGKTKLAVKLAQAVGGEIISADSRQVFVGMDIGTGKDLEEYQGVPYHLIDIKSPHETFSVSEFQRLATEAAQEIHQRGCVPILCGGSGHYIKALLQNYSFGHTAHNPYFSFSLESLPRPLLLQIHEHLELSGPTDSNRRIARSIEKTYDPPPELTPQAFEFETKIYATRPERPVLREMIKTRLEERLNHGLIEEVSGLLAQGVPADHLRKFGLEYRWVTDYLDQWIDLNTLKKSLHQGICQFAKRQETFLRYMAKEGLDIQDCPDITKLVAEVSQWLAEP